MGINKVIVLLLTTIVVVSCNRPSQEAYDDLMRDNQQLKQKLEATQTKSFEQAEAMSQAMEELAKISGRTLILRMDVENGRGRMRDVEQMSFQLNAVKEKLNQLEKLAEQGEAQRKMVRELRKMIVDKEKEIANLKQLIKDKDKQIKEQQQTIEKQHNTIATQKKESSQQATTILMQEFQLQELVNKQAVLLRDAGREFESLANDVPDHIVGKKNKQKIDDWRISMYETALDYFYEAQSSGILNTKSDITRVRGKIYQLKKLIHMKYTNLDIVNSINDRKEGKNKLSWIEKYGIYLCNTSKNIAGSVLVLSIENDDNLSVYDCYFKSKNERTKFCVNKAISVPFAEISSLLKNVKCFERNTQQYWNECFCKGQFDQIVADKKDTLQRPETKASSDPSVDLTMSDFLSTLQNLVKEAIKEIAKTANGWNKYDRIYIASADGRNTYPLVLPLKYTLYNLFETDSKKIWGEIFRVKSKEGGSIIKPLSSDDYDWKACQQYFHIGALSHAIGLNVSLELTMNDLMKADGIRVTFPLETGDDGSYTLPATPVLKECLSDNTKKISLSGVELNWADLYENVQWDYKAGNHAFKHIKLSICADGCQRLYLMGGDKVLTVISSNGSTVEVENCLKVSNAEPATIVEIPVDDHANVVEESEEEVAKPTNNKPIKHKGTSPKESRSKGSIFRAKVSAEIQKGLYIVQELLREEVYNFIVKYHPGKTVGMLIEEWINVEKGDGKLKYGDKIRRTWDEYKGKNPSWETYNNESEPIKNTEYFDFSNYYIFIDQNAANLEKEWETDLRELKSNITNLLKYVRNGSSHQNMYAIKDDDAKCSFTDMLRIVNVFNKEALAEEIRSCLDTVYELYKNKP